MKYRIIIFILFLFSCQDIKRPEKPDDLISKHDMVSILTEAYLANAAQSIKNQSLFAEEIDLDSLVYVKFNIDSIQFKRSNDYYSFNFNTYIEILNEVEENLKSREKLLDSIIRTAQEIDQTKVEDKRNKRSQLNSEDSE